MKKILVTTDFSAHSKAGMRFAIQLAAQKKAELVFFYCFQAMLPTTIQGKFIDTSVQKQAKKHLQKLEKFVAGLYASMNATPGAHRCVVVENLNPDDAILDYARQHAMDYICISTRGAGKLRKIIGTNTSDVILRSPVPVFAVPHTWRTHPIKKILYASDLDNLDAEMKTVSDFAQSLDVQADMAHFYYPGEIKIEPAVLTGVWREKMKRLDQVYLEPFDVDKGFAGQLDNLVKRVKPSMAVFFTHTNKTWFDKLFSISRSKAFSFVAKVPMLVYRK
ncbi:MAG: universal stress protein [Haliscomenobacteraceae bacterium CHB4]|nr:hypothetical protein [Saprospiraceae bacterium]MCE7926024.1 universal stress protein [Haliscomenobacteraceae bacterium CHB4]